MAARATFGESLDSAPQDPALEGLAFATGDPLAQDVADALAGNDALAELFAEDPTAEMIALSRWQGTSDGDSLVLQTELDLLLRDTDPSRRLVLAAFDLRSLGDGFEELVFALTREGSPVGGTVRLDSLEDVVAFFEDRVFELGRGSGEDELIEASFELRLNTASSFGLDLGFAQIVPEPSTGLLLLMGLLALGARRANRLR